MIAALVRRAAFTASLVVAVSFASFFAFGISLDPTWPMALDPDQTRRHELQAQFHLDEPILRQYGRWVASLPSDGFGTTVFPVGGSMIAQGSGTAIGPLVWRAAANTAQLVGVALVLSLTFSVLLGAWTAMRRTPLTGLVRLLSLVAWAVPSFVVGVILVYLVPDVGRVFPPGPPGGGVVPWLRHMTLPALSLSVALVGLYARYVRSAVIAAAHEPYANVARAKGLTEREVVTRHLLRNSVTPLVGVVALDVAGIVGISLAVDSIFGVQGLAWLFFQAVSKSDPFLLTAVLVLIALVVAAFVFLADAIVLWLDPRLRR